jgi:hypothetical protein
VPNDLDFTRIAQTGGPVRAVAALRRYVLASAGSRLLVFDVRVSRRPQLVFESQALPAEIESIVIAHPYAYVAAGDAGLFILDVSIPSQPVLVGSLKTTGTAQDVAVNGSLVYVAVRTAGLRVIDTSDVAEPIEVGFFDTPVFDILSVAVAFPHAYVTAGPNGLHVLDVSDATAPVEVAALALSGNAKGITTSLPYAYIAAGKAGLRVVDISDPSHPHEVGSSAKRAPEDAHEVAVAGGYAYVADRSVWTGENAYPGGLRTVDVSSPADPISVGNLKGDVSAIDVAGMRAYLASYDTLLTSPYSLGSSNSLDIVSLENPAAPRALGTFAIPASVSGSLAASGSSLYLHDEGLSRIDLSEPGKPHIVWNLPLPGTALPGLAISGHYAYVGAGTSGMHVVDLRDSGRPRRVATLNHEAQEVAVARNLALISKLYGGLSLVDISDASNPTVVSTITGNWSVSDMQAVGDYLYIANYAYPDPSALLIYNIGDPANPLPVGSFNTGLNASPRHVEVSGQYAYLAVGTALSGVLAVIDVSNPEMPRYVSQLELDVYFYDMTRTGNHILLTLPSIPGGGLRSIDVSDPRHPRIDGQYISPTAFAFGLAVMPNGVIALGSSLGLNVLRVGIAEN